MKKAFIITLCLLLLCAVITGCGRSGRKSGNDSQDMASQSTTVSGWYGSQMARSGNNKSFPYSMFSTMPKEETGRANGYTYPYELSTPLRQCAGFILNYEIKEFVIGDFSGDYHFEVLVRNVEGNWTSAGTFTKDSYDGFVNVRLPKLMSVAAVAVTCSRQEETAYSFEMSISSPY